MFRIVQVGANGIDNGRLWFDQKRVPRDNLLDKFGQVMPDGTYQSPIKSNEARFTRMIGALGKSNREF